MASSLDLYDSLSGLAVPPDISRMRAQAQALRQRGAQTPQGAMVGQYYAAPHWSNYLASLGQSIAGTELGRSAESREEEYRSQLAQALRTPEPIPETVRAPGYEPPSRMERLSDIADENPYAQDVLLMDALRGNEPDWQEIEVPLPDGSIQKGHINRNTSGDPADTFVPYGAPIQAEPDYPSSVEEYEFARQQGFTGSLMDYQTQKAQAGASPVNVDVDTGNQYDEDFYENLSKGSAEDFRNLQIGASDAASSLEANNKARELLDSGMITGAGAEWIVSAGKVLQQAGFNEFADPIANTEAYVASRAQEVAQIIKQFGAGTGLSDADREFAERAAAGKINMTEQSMRRILEINDEANRNIIKNFNEKLSRLDPEKIPAYYAPVEIPEFEAAGSPTAQTSDALSDTEKAELERLRQKYGQ